MALTFHSHGGKTWPQSVPRPPSQPCLTRRWPHRRPRLPLARGMNRCFPILSCCCSLPSPLPEASLSLQRALDFKASTMEAEWWIQILTPRRIICMFWRKGAGFSVPFCVFLDLQDGNYIGPTYFIGLWWGWNEHWFSQYLAHGKHSITFSYY